MAIVSLLCVWQASAKSRVENVLNDLWNYQDFAFTFACFDVAMGGACLCQWERLINQDIELAIGDPGKQIIGAARELLASL
jgi:hypothetical protein